jgi:hypothetical protein
VAVNELASDDSSQLSAAPIPGSDRYSFLTSRTSLLRSHQPDAVTEKSACHESAESVGGQHPLEIKGEDALSTLWTRHHPAARWCSAVREHSARCTHGSLEPAIVTCRFCRAIMDRLRTHGKRGLTPETTSGRASPYRRHRSSCIRWIAMACLGSPLKCSLVASFHCPRSQNCIDAWTVTTRLGLPLCKHSGRRYHDQTDDTESQQQASQPAPPRSFHLHRLYVLRPARTEARHIPLRLPGRQVALLQRRDATRRRARSSRSID